MLILPTRRKLLTGVAALAAYSALPVNPAKAAVALVANTIVRSAGNAAPGDAPTVNSTGASLVVVGTSSYNANGGGQTVTDNYGNTYTGVAYAAVGYDEVKIFYCINPTVGASHTVNIAGFSGYTTATIAFFSGLDTGAAIQDSSFGSTASGSTANTGAATPSATGDLAVGVYSQAHNSASGTITVDSGATITNQAVPGDGSSRNGAMAYLVAANTSDINLQFGGLASTGDGQDAAIAIFKATAGGGGGGAARPRGMMGIGK